MIAAGQAGNTFDEVTVRFRAPASSGVYALYDSQRWIYVGESQDIQSRLLQHLRGDSPEIAKYRPTGFAFELVPANMRVARQNELIVALQPPANQRLG